MRKPIALVLGVVVFALTAAALAAKPPGVTLAVAKPTVVYGSTDVLSGQVSSKQAGEKVIVMAQTNGSATFTPLATVDTTTGGAWTYTASPTIQTAYEAQWLTNTSNAVAVKVRPQLTLAKVSLSGNRGTFSVKATADRPFTGKFVLVQRLSASGVVQLRKIVLGSDSSATFTVKVPAGTSRLRAVMPTSQTEPGYISAQSAVLVVTR
jgi:hypothetical protein